MVRKYNELFGTKVKYFNSQSDKKNYGASLLITKLNQSSCESSDEIC